MATLLIFFGLIALFWSNWFFALAGGLIFSCIMLKYHTRFAFFESNRLRVIGELACFILAVIGLWFFPLIPAGYAHFFAAATGLVFAHHIFTCLQT